MRYVGTTPFALALLAPPSTWPLWTLLRYFIYYIFYAIMHIYILILLAEGHRCCCCFSRHRSAASSFIMPSHLLTSLIGGHLCRRLSSTLRMYSLCLIKYSCYNVIYFILACLITNWCANEWLKRFPFVRLCTAKCAELPLRTVLTTDLLCLSSYSHVHGCT